ncbi:hypothetical protein V5F77_21980 [Xanthobacter sp. DSM 24535]|uniref:hypothetical protein n=1 Tax=Roseixanthobacter psychrophilus TaxID=3119917 RepID=UPI0037265A2A
MHDLEIASVRDLRLRQDRKARFWEAHARSALNTRQRLVVNRLLNGFEGKLTSSKYATPAKCS